MTDLAAALRTALVIGATGGVGRALAARLASRGYRLVLVGRNAEALQSLRHQFGDRASVLAIELTDPRERQRLFSEVPESDFVAIVAGSARAGAFDASARGALRDTLALGIDAPTEICHHYGSRMAVRGGGQLLIIGSAASMRPAPGLALYAAGKAFLRALSRSLAAEWAGRDVTVTCCLPGPLQTAFARKAGLAPAAYETSADEIARIALRAVDRRRSIVIAPLRTRLLYVGLSLIGERARAWLALRQWQRRGQGARAP